jgi:SAM-dependent methyltransferase
LPDLDADLHVRMLDQHRRRNSLLRRIRRALKAARRELKGTPVYGMRWGDPETLKFLKYLKDAYLAPYVRPDAVVVEIGPGGGRWTRYLLPARRVYLVDFHAEVLDELRRTVAGENLVFVKNDGTDFPGIDSASVDFLWSYGTFVHLDAPLIEAYLKNMRRILKPDAVVVLQYSDMTKVMARRIPGFADNDPETMRRMVKGAGYTILEEDLTSLCHSSVVRFRP